MVIEDVAFLLNEWKRIKKKRGRRRHSQRLRTWTERKRGYVYNYVETEGDRELRKAD